MTKRVADLLVETLQAAVAKTCYGIVGDTLNLIAHAIERRDVDDAERILYGHIRRTRLELARHPSLFDHASTD